MELLKGTGHCPLFPGLSSLVVGSFQSRGAASELFGGPSLRSISVNGPWDYETIGSLARISPNVQQLDLTEQCWREANEEIRLTLEQLPKLRDVTLRRIEDPIDYIKTLMKFQELETLMILGDGQPLDPWMLGPATTEMFPKLRRFVLLVPGSIELASLLDGMNKCPNLVAVLLVVMAYQGELGPTCETSMLAVMNALGRYKRLRSLRVTWTGDKLTPSMVTPIKECHLLEDLVLESEGGHILDDYQVGDFVTAFPKLTRLTLGRDGENEHTVVTDMPTCTLGVIELITAACPAIIAIYMELDAIKVPDYTPIHGHPCLELLMVSLSPISDPQEVAIYLSQLGKSTGFTMIPGPWQLKGHNKKWFEACRILNTIQRFRELEVALDKLREAGEGDSIAWMDAVEAFEEPEDIESSGEIGTCDLREIRV